MHSYNVYKALNCENYGTLIRGSYLWIWPYSENKFNLKKSSSVHPQQMMINLLHGYEFHEAISNTVKVVTSGSGV